MKRYFATMALSTGMPEDCKNLLRIFTTRPLGLDIPSCIETLQIVYPAPVNYKSDYHPETDAFENNLLPVLRLLSNSRALKGLEFHICFPPFKLHNPGL